MGPTNPYHLPTEAVQRLADDADALAEANEQAMAAKAMYRAAILRRNERAAACADSAAGIAAQVYANPEVSPTMIVGLGLAPRTDSRTRIVPKTPPGLVASAQGNGTVLLTWDRGGNASSVMFLVETRTPGEPWSIVLSTTRTRVKLSGVAPGVQTEFRVVASKSERRAVPSNVAVVYPPVAALRMAA